MAADILLYDTDEVPVGDDQRQHVELTRDIAIRFNHRFGDTFVVPKATFPTVGARVMDLQQPDGEDVEVGGLAAGHGAACSTRPRRSRRRSSRRSPTAGPRCATTRDEKPGVSNLLEIYAAATGVEPSTTRSSASSRARGYGAFKSAVADAVVEYLRPVRERYDELSRDPASRRRAARVGADAAAEIANRRARAGVRSGRGCCGPDDLARSAGPGQRVHQIGRARRRGPARRRSSCRR